MKPAFFLAVVALLLESAAFAQTALPVAPNTPAAPTSAAIAETNRNVIKAARRLMSVDALWNKPLDWNEVDSSTVEIVAHVRKALGDEAPTIEVRGKDTNHSTFVLKGAPLGPTLSSLAALANFQVWAFPGRLLLAPKAALTPSELDAVQETMGGEWKGRGRWSAIQPLEQATLVLVGTELKERLAAKSVIVPAVPTPVAVPISAGGATNGPRVSSQSFGSTSWPYELPLSELSPATQGLLQDLLNMRVAMFGMPPGQKTTLDGAWLVGFNDMRGDQMELRLQPPQVAGGPPPMDLWHWYVQKKLSAKSQRDVDGN